MLIPVTIPTIIPVSNTYHTYVRGGDFLTDLWYPFVVSVARII